MSSKEGRDHRDKRKEKHSRPSSREDDVHRHRNRKHHGNDEAEFSRKRRREDDSPNRRDGDRHRGDDERDDRQRRRHDDRPRIKSSPSRHQKHFSGNNDEEDRRHNDRRRRQDHEKRMRKPDEYKWGKEEEKVKEEPKEKAKPNFELSGKLGEETNTYKGVVIKYSEPAEACKPRRRWRLYPFKGDEPLNFIPIHRQSAYLLGRQRLIADIPIDHPSCSKQHAVLQFRKVEYEKEDGGIGRRVRPYILDLESANGTFVNNQKIEPKRFVELLEKDVVKFGFSSREYVMLHEQSKDDDYEDDGGEGGEP